MVPWVLLDSVQVPGNGGELSLYQRGEEFSIRIKGHGDTAVPGWRTATNRDC
jgi:hypothetical protein